MEFRLLKLLALVFILLGVASTSYAVSADLTVQSLNANVTSVHPGDPIKFTAVLKNNGPGTIPSTDSADLEGDLSSTLNGITIDRMTCQGDVSPDTPACEYAGPFVPGETMTTTFEGHIDTNQLSFVWFVACAHSGDPITDPDPSVRNNCKLKVVRQILP